MHYTAAMKTAIYPQRRGVSSSADTFYARGQTAWDDYQRNGVAVPAAEVLDRLEAKLNAKCKLLGG